MFINLWRRKKDKKMAKITVDVRVVRIGRYYIGMTQLGGVNVRGGTREDPVQAAQSLFQVLGGVSGNTDDSLLAVSLALDGTDLEETMALETNGDDTP